MKTHIIRKNKILFFLDLLVDAIMILLFTNCAIILRNRRFTVRFSTLIIDFGPLYLNFDSADHNKIPQVHRDDIKHVSRSMPCTTTVYRPFYDDASFVALASLTGSLYSRCERGSPRATLSFLLRHLLLASFRHNGVK